MDLYTFKHLEDFLEYLKGLITVTTMDNLKFGVFAYSDFKIFHRY
jgi:hypothetical protein